MTSELHVRATHRGGMRVQVDDGVHQVMMDYPLRQDEPTAGPMPLQMLLASLAACSADSVMAVLQRRLHEPVAGLEVEVCATRQQEHPTVLTDISLDFLVRGSGVDPAAVSMALQLSEEQLCPVWNMLKGGTPIRASFRLAEEQIPATA